jgi:hypothetical protein
LVASGDWLFGDWSHSGIGRILGNSGIGRSRIGRSRIGRSKIGRSEIGRCTYFFILNKMGFILPSVKIMSEQKSRELQNYV